MAWDMHLLQTRKLKKKTIYFSFLFYKAIGISQHLQQIGKIIIIHVSNSCSSSRISSTLSVIKLYSDIKKI